MRSSRIGIGVESERGAAWPAADHLGRQSGCFGLARRIAAHEIPELIDMLLDLPEHEVGTVVPQILESRGDGGKQVHVALLRTGGDHGTFGQDAVFVVVAEEKFSRSDGVVGIGAGMKPLNISLADAVVKAERLPVLWGSDSIKAGDDSQSVIDNNQFELSPVIMKNRFRARKDKKQNVDIVHPQAVFARAAPPPELRVAFSLIAEKPLAVRGGHSFAELAGELSQVSVIQAERLQSGEGKGDVETGL